MHSIDLRLSKFQEMVKDREAWRAAVHGVSNSQTWLSDWTTTTGLCKPDYSDRGFNSAVPSGNHAPLPLTLSAAIGLATLGSDYLCLAFLLKWL